MMKKIFLGMVVAYFVMMTTAAYGFNEADLKKLKETRQCPKCDLIKADLSRADLTGANLSGSNLSGSNLSGANLSGAKLYKTDRSTDLSNANLTNTNLSMAMLQGADLRNADLSGAHLQGAILTGAKLEKANLSNANLSGARMEGAILTGAILAGAKLENANLSGARLEDAILTGAILTGAKLDKAELSNAILRGAKLDKADLSNAILRGARLESAILTGAILTNANMTNTNLSRANMPGANLTGAKLDNANLSGANLTGAKLDNANLSGANLQGASLEGAILTGAKLDKAELSNANLSGARLEGAILTGAILTNANMTNTNLSRANMPGANLTGAKLDNANLSQATWTDGKKCSFAGSIGKCIFVEEIDKAGFSKSATAFSNETKTFTAESKLLIDNTQEVDTALLNLENALSVPSKVATALKQLNNTLANIKQIIVVAKQVPQTRAKAEELEKNVDAIKPSVEDAAKKAEAVAKAVEPVRTAANKTETVVSTALDYEIVFRTFALTYFDGINKLIACSTANPDIMAKTQKGTIKILDGSTASFKVIDTGITKVNQTYASTVAMPEKALKATISEISEQIKQLEPILTSVNGLQDKLKTLNNTLAELRKVLDQSIEFSFDYPCGTKICSQSMPYLCGTQMCKGDITDYPCPKTCYEEVPYPCGVKMCSEGVSMSLSTVINGADAIETKIESLLSSTLWQALKTIGVKKYVDDLINRANSLTNPVLSKLNLDIAMNLPDMNFNLNTVKLDASIPQFTALTNPMTQIGNSIDMKNPVFAPDIAKLQGLQKDIGVACPVQAQPFTPPQPPKRIKWKKMGW